MKLKTGNRKPETGNWKMARPMRQLGHHWVVRVLQLALVFLFVFDLSIACAESAKQRFTNAQACAAALRENAKAQRLRDNWLKCAEQFDALIKSDPAGPYAAAGLLAVGQLYEDLYGVSGKQADRQVALDYYRQCARRFAKSAQAAKANQAIEKLNPDQVPVSTTREAKSGPVEPPAAAQRQKDAKAGPSQAPAAAPKGKGAAAGPAEPPAYQNALACREALDKSPDKKRLRHHWTPCIKAFEKAIREAPAGQWRAAAYWGAGELYQDLYRISQRREDADLARDNWEQAARQRPKSEFTAKAQARLNDMGAPMAASPPAPTAPVQEAPEPPPSPTVAAEPEPPADSANQLPQDQGGEPPKATAGAQALVTGLRFWSNPSYTRVVINADREVDFDHRLLKQDPSLDKPQRLYVDLSHARLDPGIERSLPINDDLLSDARAGQYTPETVRVVVDIKSIKNYKVFSMRNPFRIVLDLWGMEAGAPPREVVVKPPEGGEKPPEGGLTPPSPSEPVVPAPPSKPPTKDSLARQLALGVRRIVIDPGHGGKDFGAPGAIKGVHEKRIVLEIAKRLATKIRGELACEVLLTRSDDRFLTLEERTAFANTRNADLFVSIHTNSARTVAAYGIETYFLNLATDQDAIEVAATENATSTKNISDLQTILNDLMQNAKINESSRLAGHVQHALYAHLQKKYGDIKNKGVKQAPFYVLLGAQMPAILVETSFISNPKECQRLTDEAYQERICEAIIAGIRNYIKELNPGALSRQQSVPARPEV